MQPVSRVVSITEKRSLMPILSNILIHFKPEGTTAYSTDLEVSAITNVECFPEEEKKVVVHGRKFLEILRELDNEDVSIQISDNIMSIKQKKTDITLSLQDSEEFPETKEIVGKEEFFLKGSELVEMIEKVGFAVSVDETRYILTGMFMKGSPGNMAVVGTDGFRMALYQRKIDGLQAFQGITIPRRSIAEIEKVIDDEDNVKISIEEKHVQFSTEKIKIISRIIEGSFPDYENVLPTANTNMANVGRENLLKGLKRVSAIIGRAEPIKMTVTNNRMVIDAESDIGKAREEIEIVYDGDEISLNFNVRFLLEVVTHIVSDTIIMAVPKAYGAVLFKGDQSDDYQNIVMPIRV